MKIVVTGSSSGIGRALAESLLQRGDQVWGIARSDQSALQEKYPDRFGFTRGDVAQWENMAQAAGKVAEAWTHIDAIITCAGLQGEISPVLSADPERWSATVRANLDGTFYAARAFAPLLALAPRRAKIVCFSGGGATKPRVNFSAYGVAKTGVLRLVETIAEEEAGRPLDINAVAPGAVNTGMVEEIIALGAAVAGEAEYQSALKQKQSGGASLQRALDLVAWLLSPASDGISGRLISAPWDPWPSLDNHAQELAGSDIFTLRRIIPEDRGKKWE